MSDPIYLKNRLRMVRSKITEHETSGNHRQLRMFMAEEADILTRLGEHPPRWEDVLKSEHFKDRMLVQAVAIISTEGENRYRAPETIFEEIVAKTYEVRKNERDSIHQSDGS